ncbi:MAG: cation:H+ antiporter [Gammaproteobacteria bacterium]|jgi:cation:H+ antiporter
MLISIAAVIVGLAILVWSADKFVEGAASVADHLGVSHLIIGITIIGFGTSAPEISVSVIAVLGDNPGLAIGNALGSNIANIGLILGVTAILINVPVSTGIFRREYPLLAIATAVMAWCLYDLHLSMSDGIILVGLLLVMLAYLIKSHSGKAEGTPNEELDIDIDASLKPSAAWGWIVIGLILLVASSKLLVWGATDIARELGVSDLIIGLTIVALGTSLPELAAAIASLKKQASDLAIGNVIGSNLFNSLAVVGIPAILMDFEIESDVIARDLPVVILLTLLLFVFSRFPAGKPPQLTRIKGYVLLSSFVIYQLYLYYEVTGSRLT